MQDKEPQQKMKKILFHTTLDQVNFNLFFKYEPKKNQELQNIPHMDNGLQNEIKIKRQHVEQKHIEQIAVKKDGRQSERVVMKGRKKYGQKWLDKKKIKEQKKLKIQYYEQQQRDDKQGIKQVTDKDQLINEIKYEKSWRDIKYQDNIFKDDIFQFADNQPYEEQKPRKVNPTHKPTSYKSQQNKSHIHISNYSQKPYEQEEYYTQKRYKKLDLSIIKDEPTQKQNAIFYSEGEQFIEPRTEEEELRGRTDRNKKIGVYIQKVLQSVNKMININDLLVYVLRKYRNDLFLISEDDKRQKRFQGLRRRIYEYISVLSAVGRIEKQEKKYLQPLKKVKNELQNSEKQQAFINLKHKQMIGQFKKQVYFDALTRIKVHRALKIRNGLDEQASNNLDPALGIINVLDQPLKFLIGHRAGMSLRTLKTKQNLKLCDLVKLNTPGWLKAIHQIDLYSHLRRILPFREVQVQRTQTFNKYEEEYFKRLQNEDKFDQNQILRERLLEKIRQRKFKNLGQQKLKKEQKKQGNEEQ